MPRHNGPRLVVQVPGGQVWEPVRDDFDGLLERMLQVVAHVPVAEQVWEVET